jgi:hypothetical protein
MEYACIIWDPVTQKNIRELEMVQRRAARIVTGDYRTTSRCNSDAITLCLDFTRTGADVSAQESIDVVRLLNYCAYMMVP